MLAVDPASLVEFGYLSNLLKRDLLEMHRLFPLQTEAFQEEQSAFNL